MKQYLRSSGFILCCMVMAAGCNPNNKARVTVTYDQVANFRVYSLSPDSSSTTGAGDGMFIQYKITRISNVGEEAKTFIFDKHKIVAVASDQLSNEEPSGDNILLGPKLAHNITVAPGETKNNVGCIIKHVLTNNPQALANTSAMVDLVHQVDAKQPVSMQRAAGDTTTAFISTALPSTLQNLCGN